MSDADETVADERAPDLLAALARRVNQVRAERSDYWAGAPLSADQSSDPLVKRIALAWLHHQGYTDADIARGEAQTHRSSNCDFEYPNWNCTDEDGRSLHPELDALYEAEEMAVFVVELLQPDIAQAARDAALVGLVLAEARAHRALDDSGCTDVSSELWQAWFRTADALDAAVRARIEQEDQA